MSNHITIEFCQEDRKRIDELIGMAGWIAGALKDMAAAQPAAPAAAHPVDAVIPFTTPETFADRLREAMDAAGVKQADLVRETGLDKGAVSSYLAGKYEPKQKAVAAMAECLKVPELWLMGYDVPKTAAPAAGPEPAAEPEAPKFTKDDVQALVIKLAAPNTGKKDAARAIIYEYAKKVSDIPEDKINDVMAKLTKLAEEE